MIQLQLMFRYEVDKQEGGYMRIGEAKPNDDSLVKIQVFYVRLEDDDYAMPNSYETTYLEKGGKLCVENVLWEFTCSCKYEGPIIGNREFVTLDILNADPNTTLIVKNGDEVIVNKQLSALSSVSQVFDFNTNDNLKFELL